MSVFKELHTHSDGLNFEEQMKQLLLYRKIVKVEEIDDQTALITLDNGTKIKTVGNDGCAGCGNGWYYLKELNNCDNVVTNVECVIEESDKYSEGEIYKIFVYAEDNKINLLSYEGRDNGYYGTGYDVYVEFVEQ